MAESIDWARATVADALPGSEQLKGRFAADGGMIGGMSLPSISAIGVPGLGVAGTPAAGPLPGAPIDPALDAQFAERKARVAALRIEGPRALRSGSYRRAAELCRAWADLELGNADAWRCLGEAQQAQGYHQDAIHAFRKAKQYDPADRSLDAAIDRSQQGIVADFLRRHGR